MRALATYVGKCFWSLFVLSRQRRRVADLMSSTLFFRGRGYVIRHFITFSLCHRAPGVGGRAKVTKMKIAGKGIREGRRARAGGDPGGGRAIVSLFRLRRTCFYFSMCIFLVCVYVALSLCLFVSMSLCLFVASSAYRFVSYLSFYALYLCPFVALSLLQLHIAFCTGLACVKGWTSFRIPPPGFFILVVTRPGRSGWVFCVVSERDLYISDRRFGTMVAGEYR